MKTNSESGFTLIEISVAIAVLVVGVLSLLALYPVGLVSSKRSENLFIASHYARLLMSELDELDKSNPPFVDGYVLQNKFPSGGEYFYIMRIKDLGGLLIPGDGNNFPDNMFSIRLSIYSNDCYAGGVSTNPNTPTGKAIKTFSRYF